MRCECYKHACATAASNARTTSRELLCILRVHGLLVEPRVRLSSRRIGVCSELCVCELRIAHTEKHTEREEKLQCPVRHNHTCDSTTSNANATEKIYQLYSTHLGCPALYSARLVRGGGNGEGTLLVQCKVFGILKHTESCAIAWHKFKLKFWTSPSLCNDDTSSAQKQICVPYGGTLNRGSTLSNSSSIRALVGSTSMYYVVVIEVEL